MKKIFYWIPSFLFMLLIFFGSGDSESGAKSLALAKFLIGLFSAKEPEPLLLETLIFIIRKGAHITEYFLLSVCNFYAFSNTIENTSVKKVLFYSSFLSFIYAVSDELHQVFVSSRVGTYEDVLIDTVGILIAYLFLYYYTFFREKRSKFL